MQEVKKDWTTQYLEAEERAEQRHMEMLARRAEKRKLKQIYSQGTTGTTTTLKEEHLRD